MRTLAIAHDLRFASIRTYHAGTTKTAILTRGGAKSDALDARRKFRDRNRSQIVAA